MKKISTIVIIALFFGIAANAQVLFQSNFENWTSGNPDGWVGDKTNLPSDSIIQVTTGAQFGSNACQLQNRTSNHKRFTTQQLTVNAGTSYEIKFWAKGQGDIRTALFDSDWGAYNTYITLNTTSWTEYTQIVTAVANSDTAEFIFSIRNTVPAGNHIQLDSVVIKTTTVASTSIYDIQYTTDAGGNSPLMNQTVNTGGIVTGVSGSGYFIQDSPGQWHGVYVYNNTNSPSVGDSVTMTATVSEYLGLTELTGVANFMVVTTGNPLPAASGISTGSMGEAYEGVLIHLTDAVCTNANAGFGMWTLNDGSGALNADDDLYAFTPTLNAHYNVTGIGHYSFSEFKILPRDANDIVMGLNEVDKVNFRMYPNPAGNQLSFEAQNPVQKVEITGMSGKLIRAIDMGNITEGQVNLDGIAQGVYMVKFHFSNNTVSIQKLSVE
ncbi:MAG: T9SS type A sorting domain-containing protein [Bacteroidota bacterium]